MDAFTKDADKRIHHEKISKFQIKHLFSQNTFINIIDGICLMRV